jgi:hypothetical protein
MLVLLLGYQYSVHVSIDREFNGKLELQISFKFNRIKYLGFNTKTENRLKMKK